MRRKRQTLEAEPRFGSEGHPPNNSAFAGDQANLGMDGVSNPSAFGGEQLLSLMSNQKGSDTRAIVGVREKGYFSATV